MAAWKDTVSAIERRVKCVTGSVSALTRRKVGVRIGVTAERLVVIIDDGVVSEQFSQKFSPFRGSPVEAEKIAYEAAMRWCEKHRELNRKP